MKKKIPEHLLNAPVLLTKSFFFEAAHYLPEYNGKCRNLHGHSYRLQVTVAGVAEQHSGMVLDFKELKSLVERIIDDLDHAYLNDIFDFVPTCENMVLFLWHELEQLIPESVILEEVKLWETNDSFATLQRKAMQQKVEG